jgi:predicted cupin superfamily sugar epimerase
MITHMPFTSCMCNSKGMVADYVLLGEAVAPGFDVAGHHYVTTEELKAAVTEDIFQELSGLLRARDDPTFDSYYDR